MTERDDNLSLACVSRRFHVVCETSTFSCIALNSLELPAFNQYFRYVHRRSALRHIRYSIQLPPYSPNSATWFESVRTKHVNNKVFTMAMVGLLQILNSWEKVFPVASFKNHSTGIYLQLCEVYSDSDPDHRSRDFKRQLGLRCWTGMGNGVSTPTYPVHV